MNVPQSIGAWFAAWKECLNVFLVCAKSTIRFAVFVSLALRLLSPGDRIGVHISVRKKGQQHMNRFTLDIPEELHKNLRMTAAERNVSMRSIILETLEQKHGTSKAQENLTSSAQKQQQQKRSKKK